MTIYNILSLLFGSGVLVTFGSFLFKRIKENEAKTEAVQLGVQALLRDRLIYEYNKYMQQGYCPIYAKENFENMWRQYHSLGKNGVMDGLHEDINELPTEPR